MKILLTTDGNPAAIHAISLAVKALNMKDANVLVVSVLNPELHTGGNQDATSDLNGGLELLRATGITAAAELLRGTDYADAILSKAEAFGADVIVMGSSHKSRLQKALLGSVSAAVATRSTRPVLVVPYHP